MRRVRTQRQWGWPLVIAIRSFIHSQIHPFVHPSIHSFTHSTNFPRVPLLCRPAPEPAGSLWVGQPPPRLTATCLDRPSEAVTRKERVFLLPALPGVEDAASANKTHLISSAGARVSRPEPAGRQLVPRIPQSVPGGGGAPSCRRQACSGLPADPGMLGGVALLRRGAEPPGGFQPRWASCPWTAQGPLLSRPLGLPRTHRQLYTGGSRGSHSRRSRLKESNRH